MIAGINGTNHARLASKANDVKRNRNDEINQKTPSGLLIFFEILPISARLYAFTKPIR